MLQKHCIWTIRHKPGSAAAKKYIEQSGNNKRKTKAALSNIKAKRPEHIIRQYDWRWCRKIIVKLCKIVNLREWRPNKFTNSITGSTNVTIILRACGKILNEL